MRKLILSLILCIMPLSLVGSGIASSAGVSGIGKKEGTSPSGERFALAAFRPYAVALPREREAAVKVNPSDVEAQIAKLKDRSYTSTYGEGYTWYTAAENLGIMGKAAVPALIANLDTKDDYERTLTLYALLLATQEPDVKAFADDYIHANLDFDPSTHEAMVAEAKNWWAKYKNNW